MDNIIKSMIPIMQEVDPNFMEKVKKQIQEQSKNNGIDETFCFQQGTKARFEQIDLVGTVKDDKERKAESVNPNKMQSTLNETQKQDKSNSINSVEIVNLLNPDVLKKMVELPNGVKIPARQYIQEIVAPHIPGSGKYILNNGSEISAKQYIEEYILGDGQLKYKGDISKLLNENIKSNNGTININGEQISSIDIVNSLNPELMKRKVKLPNGVEISAIQYVQEVVAPHIPSDGKFILKSNGLGLSAKQFIEEAIMFEGQEKYNGDINALLEAMTVANNGTVSVKSKETRKQALEQAYGKSQEQIEREQKDKEASERIEQQTKKFKTETTEETSKKISIDGVKKERNIRK